MEMPIVHKKRRKQLRISLQKHWEVFHREITIVAALMVLLSTPFLGQVLAKTEPRTLMDRLDPAQSDEMAVEQRQSMDDFVLRYFSEELGQELTQEELDAIRIDGDYSFFMQDGSENINELTSRRDLFMNNYEYVEQVVGQMDQVTTELVHSSTPNNASLADSPVDNMILLEQKEELNAKMLQILETEKKILEIEEIMVSYKMAFMPKLEVKPPPPHLTLCSSYQGMTFPSLLDQIEIPIPGLVEEFAGIYEGYTEQAADIKETFATAKEDLKTDLEEGKEFVSGGWKAESSQWLEDKELSLEQTRDICEGNLTETFQGSTDLTSIVMSQEEACEITDMVDEGSLAESTETEAESCDSCSEAGEITGKMEHYQELIAEKKDAFLKSFIAKLQGIKPQT